MLIIDADGLSWLNVGIIVEAGTFGHGDTDAIFIQIETLSTRATIHREEVRHATLLVWAQRSARQLAPLMFVRERLSRRAALRVFFCCVSSWAVVTHQFLLCDFFKVKLKAYHTRPLSSLSRRLRLMHKLLHRRRRRHTGTPRSSRSYSWHKGSAAEDRNSLHESQSHQCWIN